ncbi:hypothetical protein PspCFBP13508_23365 [Pseudomonas sp. CFBP13508]|nr:hypothetical protein PspCFBP13508_23365 [Pseudomonas sp. CFBP13508]
MTAVFLIPMEMSATTHHLCGSEPARESGRSVNIHSECGMAFASRLAPTGGLRSCSGFCDQA